MLETLDPVVADLSGPRLAQAESGTVLVDTTAADQGWFVDPTPTDHTEFHLSSSTGELVATSASPAFGRIDLLTVVLHGMGHVLGLDDHDSITTCPP